MGSFDAPMLSSGRWEGGGRRCLAGQGRDDLAGDVALEATDDLAFAEAFGGAALDVGAGGCVVAHADDGDDIEGAAGGAVTAAAESVATGGAAAAGRLRGNAAELGEGGLAAEPFGVVAGGHVELAGQFDTDAEQLNKLGGGESDEVLDLPVECLDLLIEHFPAPGQVAQRGLDAGREETVGVVDERDQIVALGAQPQASVDEGAFGEHEQLVPQRRRSADHDAEQGVEGLGAGPHRAGPGDAQGADDLDEPGLGLGGCGSGLAEH